jgi:uncharacterized DUF497 family protein
VNNKDFVVEKLEWDEVNIAHIARHNISTDEVEEVCDREPVVKEGHKNRLFLIGSTKQGRMVTVILNPTEREDEYRPITAYEASKSSIRVYEEEIRKGGEAA